MKKLNLTYWAIIIPLTSWLLYFIKPQGENSFFTFLLSIFLISSVLAAVHHAEVIAHKVGEPFGTLILAVAITIIEVSLIVSLMLAGGPDAMVLARDTVFAAIMIIITGILGLCLLVGGFRHHEQLFGMHGVNAALTTLTAIAALTLILPNFTTSVTGPFYSNTQLIFVAIISLILYGGFVMIQTVRHRDYFLPAEAEIDESAHAAPPGTAKTVISLVILLASLGVVVLLAKALAPVIENGVDRIGAPKSLVGIVVALVILLPEGIAAVKAARKNRLQTSLNLALGSALASIGLTIPAVAITSMAMQLKVTLGIDAKSIVLLVLSLFTVMLSFGTGRTTILQGVVLIVLFIVYVFTTVFP